MLQIVYVQAYVIEIIVEGHVMYEEFAVYCLNRSVTSTSKEHLALGRNSDFVSYTIPKNIYSIEFNAAERQDDYCLS